MELRGARALVVGATGVLGQAVTRALADAGCRCVATGRDTGRLSSLSDVTEGRYELDLLDVEAGRDATRRAAEDLGGLDLVVVTSGVAAFGAASETPDGVTEELFAVNTLGPMAVLAAAVTALGDGGTLVGFSAILADAPMAGMAPYSASKAALSAYLTALRREVRRAGVRVLDVRPPHVDTGLVDRALHGSPPKLPPGHELDDLVGMLLEGLRTDASELVWDPSAKALALR